MGSRYILLISTDGHLYSWGTNDHRQLGLGKASDPVRRATRVGTRSDWATVVARRAYAGPAALSDYTPASAGIDSDGTLYLWGSNATALLGTGEEGLERELQATPAPV